jgi:pyridoxamine 5'-phosphate oxidase
MSIADIRDDYKKKGLSRSDLLDHPFKQFDKWMSEAIEADLEQPNAMTLATASREGQPSARIVLLKEVDQNGFVFFTNYNGRKGKELEANPRAALVFMWSPQARQVRVEGTVHRISDLASEAYFKTRPLGSRIGAWASPQSQIVSNRAELESLYGAYAEKFSNGEVPRPAHWGGYCLVPNRVEFWQGQPNRLHDRFRYLRTSTGWDIDRLAP